MNGDEHVALAREIAAKLLIREAYMLRQLGCEFDNMIADELHRIAKAAAKGCYEVPE